MNVAARQTVERSTGWLGFLFGVVILLGLLAWQAWMTLGLFGDEPPWPNLMNDRPVMDGAHPQSLYLSKWSALTLLECGSNCFFDPFFQAGYPKTPVFDGCRFAELVLFGLNHLEPAAAYKIGIAAMCMLVPFLLVLACWGAGTNGTTTLLACALGLAVWWGPQGRGSLDAGDAEFLLASLAMLAHIALLIRFDNAPGLRAWAGLLLTGAFACLGQPMLVPIALPLVLIYYLSAGARHALPWHLALAAAEIAAIGVNVPWLTDWIAYWWLRSPLPSASELLPHRTFHTFWDAPIWGGPSHRLLALALFGSGSLGAVIWNQTRQRAAARLLGLGATALLVLALLGISWEPLGQMGTSIFLAPALWFACIPAAHGWTWLLGRLARTGLGRCLLFVTVTGFGAAGYMAREELEVIGRRAIHTTPLEFGLSSERQALVAVLRDNTTQSARILWEDRKLSRRESRWSVLLPLLTERFYIGGLDPAGVIEHSSISFVNESLERRHISHWTDGNLEEYCKRYNISWVVAWSPAVIERYRKWPGVDREMPVRDDVPGVLFTLKPHGGSFVTRGKAEIVRMDCRHITLADVVPENGEVVLNLHYFAGLKATPSRVQVQREPPSLDPIGFIRLKVSEPTPRVTLKWDHSR
jgi:hypothetical protein